ncbi:MAG: phospho-N-acetylmuramoyl-pentapeptide-transferase [Lachnospiraceae bacterium]|nr:phospho-N-acetylmuramoyl-pentapeptide-transferase [Lachnospiraceae bacterium]
MYGLFRKFLSGEMVIAIGAVITFLITFFVLKFPPAFLPKDQGRAFAVNGQLSKGKLRGVGLLFVAVFFVTGLIFLPFNLEYLFYGILLCLMMLSGYLDDASETPWSDYKKGAIDFALSVLAMVNFLTHNEPVIKFVTHSVRIPVVLYAILGIVLIWVSVNVTNCSDGVDGLCGSVSVVAFMAYAGTFYRDMGPGYVGGAVLFAAALLAYLIFNWHPSKMLMGDAGSRAIGFFLAVLAMKSTHPFSFLLLGLVFILDGGLGLVKVFVMRFFKIPFLKNIRCPLHDQLRKNMGWSDVAVVSFMILSQITLSALTWVLISLSF